MILFRKDTNYEIYQRTCPYCCQHTLDHLCLGFSWNDQLYRTRPGLDYPSLTFLLATRNALLEKWFHGIEKMYAYHKFTAIFSVVLLALHNVAMGGSLWGSHLAAQLGNVGIYLFVSIVLVAYLGKHIKYEAWRWIHRFVYLAYIFGLLHAYMLMGARLLTPTLLGFVVGFYAIIGLASGFTSSSSIKVWLFAIWGKSCRSNASTTIP